MLAIEVTADPGGVAVVALLAVAVLVLVARGGRIAGKLGSIEAKVEGIDHAVNQKPPGTTPIKEHAEVAAEQATSAATTVGEVSRRLQVVELQVATAGEHAAQGRRLARRAAANTIELTAKVDAIQSDIRQLIDTPTDPGGTS